MNKENQDVYEELENSIKLSLGFLKGKNAKIKSMEEEIDLLNDDINKDASKGYDIEAKTKKLDSLEKALYDFETMESDVLLECTHINNINNCILKVNGNRVETFGDAKNNFEKDTKNKIAISDILEKMESELAKIKDENETKKELRNKIVKSELHINGLNSRIKLYNDKYSKFVEKENSIKSKLKVDDDVLHNLIGKISSISDENKNINDDIVKAKEDKAELAKRLEEKNKELEDKENSKEQLGLAVNNDIKNINLAIKNIEEKMSVLDSKIYELNQLINTNRLDLKKANEELKKYKAQEPLFKSYVNFLNSQIGNLEDYDDVNSLWKEKFSSFKSNVEQLAKDVEYPFSNANGVENSTVNPLIEYTERLSNMISFIKEKGLQQIENLEDEDDIVDFRDDEITPVKSKLNPYLIGAIALGGALLLTNK